MDEQNKTAALTTAEEEDLKEIGFTLQELAEKLIKEGKVEIQTGQTLTIRQIELSDFLSLVEEPKPSEKARLFIEIMKRFSLEVFFEGSLALGPFRLADQSWSFDSGNTGFLRIFAKRAPFKKSLEEVVSFLSKLKTGQALVLEPNQDLFLINISADAMFNYYQHCQDETNLVLREKGQDEMFTSSCKLLEEKNMLLKVYGLNTKQVDRTIDAAAGGMFFKPVGSKELKEPRIVIGLIQKP